MRLNLKGLIQENVKMLIEEVKHMSEDEIKANNREIARQVQANGGSPEDVLRSVKAADAESRFNNDTVMYQNNREKDKYGNAPAVPGVPGTPVNNIYQATTSNQVPAVPGVEGTPVNNVSGAEADRMAKLKDAALAAGIENSKKRAAANTNRKTKAAEALENIKADRAEADRIAKLKDEARAAGIKNSKKRAAANTNRKTKAAEALENIKASKQQKGMSGTKKALLGLGGLGLAGGAAYYAGGDDDYQ